MTKIADIYFRKFEERGFITFTKIDSFVEDFMEQLATKGIKTIVQQHTGFITVTKK